MDENNKDIVYVLTHEYIYGKAEKFIEGKMLGILSNKEQVQEEINYYKELEGFNEFADECFKCREFEVDKNQYWLTGFEERDRELKEAYRMIILSSKMKNKINANSGTVNYKKINKIVRNIIRKTRRQNECIIYNTSGRMINILNKLKNKEQVILSDYTGFEMESNEISYFNNEIDIWEYCYFIKTLFEKLNEKYNRSFVVYLYETMCNYDEDSQENNRIDIRFHVYREEEGYYYTVEDLDAYDSNIMCCKFLEGSGIC